MNKVHICNIICLCPLPMEQEAKPSRDCSIVPDRAAFSHRQVRQVLQQGGQGSVSVVWKQFKSVIYLTFSPSGAGGQCAWKLVARMYSLAQLSSRSPLPQKSLAPCTSSHYCTCCSSLEKDFCSSWPFGSMTE